MSLCIEAKACQENNFITWHSLATQSHMKGSVVNSGFFSPGGQLALQATEQIDVNQ